MGEMVSLQQPTLWLKPDATGHFAWRNSSVALLLEYEERAIGPVYMRERFLRYQRYHQALEAAADFDGPWAVFVLFPDAAAAARFTTLSLKYMRRRRLASSNIPLYVSSIDVLLRDGVLAPSWVRPGNEDYRNVGLDAALNSL